MAEEQKNYIRQVSAAQSDLFAKLGKRKLSHLDIELTERCNNACIHCSINLPENDAEAQRRELTTEELERILDEAARLGCLRVRYTGGEPLLRPDFKDLYLYAKRLGMKVVLFTNATLIDRETAALLQRYPPGEVVEVTVYGMRRETYEAVTRRKGTFEAAFRGMELLREFDIPFIVKGALMTQNREDIEAFEAFAKSVPALTHPPTYSMLFDLRVSRDSEAANERIRRLRPQPEELLAYLTRDHEAYVNGMREFCGKFMRPSGAELFGCGAGRKNGAINAYGGFQLCMLLRHPATVYDLRRGTLEDALDNFFPKIAARTAENPDYLQRCAECFLKGLCEQCPGKAWIEHGELDRPVEYLCEVAHAQARLLGLLGENEFSWQIKNWRERIAAFSGVDISERNETSKRNDECL